VRISRNNASAVPAGTHAANRLVAQSCSGLYRRFAIGSASALSKAFELADGLRNAILPSSKVNVAPTHEPKGRAALLRRLGKPTMLAAQQRRPTDAVVHRFNARNFVSEKSLPIRPGEGIEPLQWPVPDGAARPTARSFPSPHRMGRGALQLSTTAFFRRRTVSRVKLCVTGNAVFRRNHFRSAFISFLLTAFIVARAWSAAPGADRAALVQAIIGEEGDQAELVSKLSASSDSLVGQTLEAWRVGEVFLHEASDGAKIPFLLDKQTDADGKARANRILDGEPLRDSSGKPLSFTATDLTAVDTSRSLRKVIKQTLDLMALSNPDPKFRRDAASRLGFEQNQDYVPFFESRLATEKQGDVRKALAEAIAITQLASDNADARKAAIRQLGELRSISGQNLLREISAKAQANPKTYDAETLAAARAALTAIDEYIFWGNLFGTLFRGLSLGAVLLIAALGLAITFGLMGVINMAHGEVIMVGAYAAYVTQNIFKARFGESGFGFDIYFPVALVVAFAASALLGLILERGIIRFLYARPLESLLATWGVSLILQQIFRAHFGAANVFVASPSWLRGAYSVHDVLFAYNRIFVIGFAACIVWLTYLLMTKTAVGLQIRAVMQNRNMAACMGVRTNRMNMITFAFGSGLAGLAGACLAQIGNVGPSLGQSYIVDCFMVVVLGGVGNIIGTVSASIGMGIGDQILQLHVQAVLAKVLVLAAVILFLQWRPAGLFVTRNRGLEG